MDDLFEQGGCGGGFGGERGGDAPLAAEEEIDGGGVGGEAAGRAGEAVTFELVRMWRGVSGRRGVRGARAVVRSDSER